jgi:hypothetical protein
VHAWSVPGVVSNGFLATLFWCTNTLSASVIVGIEAFGPAGGAALNDASATSLSVGPGATVAISTQATGFEVDAVLDVYPTAGSARVLTTASFKASQGILCSAILFDQNNPTPVSMASLPVIRKTTQQGD